MTTKKRSTNRIEIKSPKSFILSIHKIDRKKVEKIKSTLSVMKISFVIDKFYLFIDCFAGVEATKLMNFELN